MMDRIKRSGESGNALIENIIILPLIFLILYALILSMFIVHERATLEGAAKRGAIYAANCISDPNYDTILSASGNVEGELDISQNISTFSFTGVGKNIQPYRYITGSSSKGVESKTQEQIYAIVQKTRIPWRDIDIDNISVDINNKVFYQDVTVTITSTYPLPTLFEKIGLGDLEYTVTAKMAVNDPDEFIRNADLVVDVVAQIDESLGGPIEKAKEKISGLTEKLLKWIKI